MSRGILLVTSAPTSAETEPAYHEWYENVHIPEVLSVPGFVSARRLRLVGPDTSGQTGAPRYLTIYEIETADVASAAAALETAAPGMTTSDALAYDQVTTSLFEEISRT
jgi:hypothetical protein